MKAISILILINLLFTRGSDKTLPNLQRAYEAEANTAKKYELYANRADEEGFAQVAKLFRAAAESETFHMKNHASVIKKMGATPKPIKYKNIHVKSTKENLRSTLVPESTDADYSYPKYIEQAQKDGEPEAVRSFEHAKNAEVIHESLFNDALQNLGNNKPKDYYIGTSTGDIIETDMGSMPPAPDIPTEMYVKVK